MKKQLLFIASLFAAFNLSAQTQLPNSNFEEWSTDEESESEQPTSWLPATDCDVTPCLVYSEKTTDSHSGSAVKIITLKDSESGEVSSSVLGAFVFPFADKPTKVTFWYKSSATAGATIQLNTGNIFAPVTVGQGIGIFSASTEFKKAEFDVTYSSEDAPLFVIFGVSLADDEISETDYIIIDDVQLVYDVTSISNKQMADLVGSNIVTNSLNLKSNVDELYVYNSSGILALSAANTQNADFSSLPEGLYMVTLKKGNSVGTMKVIKK
ncbi:hypothetical protein MYP_1118 [Sporocytophaga myxococcoides]|uniref:Secretion system C-terminal sorting domain-containing protein n=1 Tax=Sporocytophaga myxococcoides TaxID=153721 RepID=A0A098LAG3_9BACT|nr:T9SS type A sorting domain-containing protein [Sporocytophaga myxococcoides]GAL83890.1 hypothetical protein MYP_1118 [Sporocytophaga myxococcoides]